MSRNTKIACLVAACVGVGLVSFANFRKPVDIGLKDTQIGFDGPLRTEADVVARFGRPGNYATRTHDYEFFKISGMYPPPGRREQWTDDFAIVEVYFADDGRVVGWGRALALPPKPWYERLWRDLRG